MKIFGNGKGGTPKSKKAKIPLTQKQKRTRIIIAAVAVVLALGVTGFAIWTSMVRAPGMRPNNTDIVNQDGGDEPNISMGDRVADYFTFVVGAVDEDETRTDALMVCSFDVTGQKINILNVPRDTMCNNTRKGASKKINAAYGTKKGIEQTKTELKKVVGFAPDYYIIVNFQGIADIVNAIGGVDYEVPFRMYYKDPSQHLNIDFEPGMKHMNGQEVVEFLRWRKNNGGVKTGDPHYTGGDEERITKQQEFLKYLATQVLDVRNTTKIPQIAKAVFDNVKTDFTWGEMLWMGTKAIGLPSENLKMHTLPGVDSYSYAGTGTYLSFFFPNEEKTLELVNEYFNPYVSKLTDLDVVSGPDKKSAGSSGEKHTNTKKPAEPPVEKPVQPVVPPATHDPETGAPSGDTATTPPTDGTVTPPPAGGDGTGTPPPAGGTETPPSGGDTTGGTTTPPPAGGTETPPSGADTSGGTTTPPPAGGNTTGGTTTPPPSGGNTTGGATAPPLSTADPEAS